MNNTDTTEINKQITDTTETTVKIENVEDPILIIPTKKRLINFSFSNPAPIGLTAFGMTTFLLNAHNVKLFGFNSMIFGMGIMFGGIAQIIAGILEFFKNNTFGSLAFTAYGCFWISLCILKILPEYITTIEPADPMSMSFYLFIWGCFTFGMTFGTFKGAKVHVISIVFFMLTTLFWILSLHNFIDAFVTGSWVSTVINILGGVWGMILGLLAMYLAIAEVINEKYEVTIMPIVIPQDVKILFNSCKCCVKKLPKPDEKKTSNFDELNEKV